MIIRESTFGYSQRPTEQTCAFNWKLIKMYPIGTFAHEGDSDIKTHFPRDQRQPKTRSFTGTRKVHKEHRHILYLSCKFVEHEQLF